MALSGLRPQGCMTWGLAWPDQRVHYSPFLCAVKCVASTHITQVFASQVFWQSHIHLHYHARL